MKTQEIRITIEGPQGCGKAALAFALARSLREIGFTGISMGAEIIAAGKDPLVVAPAFDPAVLAWMNESVEVSMNIRDSTWYSAGNQAFMTDDIEHLTKEAETKRDAVLKNLTLVYPDIEVNVLREETTVAQDPSVSVEQSMRKWWNLGNVIPDDLKEAAKQRDVDIYRMGDRLVVCRGKEAIMVILHPLGTDTKNFRFVKFDGSVPIDSVGLQKKEEKTTTEVMDAIRRIVREQPLNKKAVDDQALKNVHDVIAAREKYADDILNVAGASINAIVLNNYSHMMTTEEGVRIWSISSRDGTRAIRIAMDVSISVLLGNDRIEAAHINLNVTSKKVDHAPWPTGGAGDRFSFVVPRSFVPGFDPTSFISSENSFGKHTLMKLRECLERLIK